MCSITREESLHLMSMAYIIDSSSDEERAMNYIQLIVKNECERMNLKVKIKGKQSTDVSEQLKKISIKNNTCRGYIPNFM